MPRGGPEGFFATRASSRARSPTRDMTFKRLHQEGFDEEHDCREGQGVGEQQRDVEQLESGIDFEPDAVRPAINSTTSTIFHTSDKPARVAAAK